LILLYFCAVNKHFLEINSKFPGMWYEGPVSRRSHGLGGHSKELRLLNKLDYLG